MPCTKHCSICGKAFKGSFFNVMSALRKHRKQVHLKAHEESIKKSQTSRKSQRRSADPQIVRVRRKLISLPDVKSFKDFQGSGLIRVLTRKNDKFPEFAVYPRAKNTANITKSLRDAGLKQEEKGKWVLRTDRFNIFVYV